MANAHDSVVTARRSIAHLERAAALAAQGDPWAAAQHFRALVEANPDDPVAHKNLAAMLMEQEHVPGVGPQDGRLGALEHLRAAVRLAPRWGEAHYSLGLVLERQGDHHEAMRCYQRALGLDPEHASAHVSYLSITQQICDWAHIEALWERSRHWLEGPYRTPPYALTPLSIVSMPSSAAEQQEAARRYALASYAPASGSGSGTGSPAHAHAQEQPDDQPADSCDGLPARHPGPVSWGKGPGRRAGGGRLAPTLALALATGDHQRRQARGRPLRVGYLSADFRDHPVARQLVEALERHERTRVHVAAYSLGPDDDSALRSRIKGACDTFIDLSTLPAAEAARRIRDDGTDVLVDLNGWTGGYRPEIVARRPAPVQVSYLGYPATMGAPWIDYVITDRSLTPPGQRAHWTERFAQLPDCYMPADTRREAAEGPTRGECGLPSRGRGVVFCCFNNTAKVTPACFDVWMRLLQGAPGSVLWLVAWHPCAPPQLRNEAEARGVDADRLVFAEQRDHAAYLALCGLADLFLDTWPYTGGATANDALWAGLPVLTLAGETYVSRMAASQLRAVGLPDLVMSSPAQFERTALALARSTPALAHIRRRLADNRRTWPLFDMGRYTRHLEDAYGQMLSDVAARAD